MDGEFSQIFVNGGQPRAEKRVNKFAGCQVNDVEKLENLQLTWGLKKFWQPTAPPLRKLANFWPDLAVQVW